MSPRGEVRPRRAPSRRRASRRKAILWFAGAVVLVVGVLGIVAGLRLFTIARDLQHARDLMLDAGNNIEQGQLGTAREQLAQAEDLLLSSNKALYEPYFEGLGVLPVVNQNLHALRSSVGLALRLTDGGIRVLAVTQPLEDKSGKLEVPLLQGTIPLKAVRDAQGIVDDLAAALPTSSKRLDDTLVVGPIRDAQRRLADEGHRRRAQLSSLSRALDLLASLSGEQAPKRYLIAVANTAEMRGAGGMVLSYGVLTGNAGKFALGDFGGIDDLALDAPVDTSSLPQDYLQRWGGLQPTFLWRNTTLAPDLQFDAPTMMAMYRAKTGLSVDGVIQIDPQGLAAILQGTGPVQVAGLGTVTADNVVDVTLNRAYIDFPNRDQRQELLGDVAKAAFHALIDGELHSLRPLGTALFQAAIERHLMLYSIDGKIERAAAYFGATGEIPPVDLSDYAMLTVQNFSRNKLDYYIDTSLDLKGSRLPTEEGKITATVTVTNRAPVDALAKSTYVFGGDYPGLAPGLYRSTVSLYLPSGTRLDAASGDTTQAPAATTEAGRTLIGFAVDVPAGESRTVTLELTFIPRPEGSYSLLLVPVPRLRPTSISVEIDTGKGRAVRSAEPLRRVEQVSDGS